MNKGENNKKLTVTITLFFVAVFICFFIIFYNNQSSNVNNNIKAKASLTLKGDEALTIEMGNDYDEKGFKAVDSKGNDITDKVEVTGSIDINKLGTYKITYTIIDSNNNKITKVREVKVMDTVKPAITFETNGAAAAKQTHQTRVTVTDTGGIEPSSLKYLWSDLEDIPQEEVFFLKFDNDTIIKHTGTKGIYYLWIMAKDESGNTSIVKSNSFNFNFTSNPSNSNNNIPNPKTSTPEVSLLGSNQVTIEVGSNYKDAGAIANDQIDGALISMVTTDLKTDTIGTYYMTYTAINSSGKQTSKTRIINVVDTTKPVITLLGDSEVTIEVGSVYEDAGATASDNYDRDITDKILIDNPVNPGEIGIYTLTYNVTDSSGNHAVEVTRTVNVVDTTKPVITLLGDSEVTIELGSVYEDAGATASDNYDQDITDNIATTGDINPSAIGIYTLTYNVTDSSGNHAVEVTRTVNVVDTTKPVITLLGDSEVTIELGSVYEDAGATASDNYDQDITDKILIDNPVNPDEIGIYTLTYNVTDSSGNHAVEVTRTVNVATSTLNWVSQRVGASQYYDVYYSDGRWVTVGNYGTISTSTDSVTWTTQTVGTANYYDVHYSNGHWVAVGYDGMIAVSTDGETWTTQTVGAYNNYYSVYYSNGHWVVVGDNGANDINDYKGIIVTSTDGETWTTQTVDSCPSYSTVYNNGSRWVAVGGYNIISTSTDGETWTTQTVGAYNNNYYRVYYSNGRWVAVGDQGMIAVSTDGETWTTQTVETANYFDVYYSNGRWVAVGYNNNNGIISTSTDGETWTTQTMDSVTSYFGVYNDNGRWIAVGGYNIISTSTDGETWTTQTIGEANYIDVYYSNDRWVAVGDYGVISTSTDGVTWVGPYDNDYYSIYNYSGRWVAVGDYGVISTSTDGVMWTTQTLGEYNCYYSVYNYGGRWVAVGYNYNSDGDSYNYNGIISTSTDGETWVTQTAVSNVAYNNVYNYGGRWVAVGYNDISYGGIISTSTDGTTWETQAVGSYNKMYNNVYNYGGRWVAIGDNGIISTSTDGMTWETQVVGSYDNYYYSAYNYGGRWVTVGNQGIISTSTDGVTWTTQTSGAYNDYYGVYNYNGLWVAVGNSGIISTSTDGETWETQTVVPNADYNNIYNYGGRWVAVGFIRDKSYSYNGIISTSTDGKTWTTQYAGPGMYYSSFLDNNIIVMVGINGKITTVTLNR